jgi:hypothetical protein
MRHALWVAGVVPLTLAAAAFVLVILPMRPWEASSQARLARWPREIPQTNVITASELAKSMDLSRAKRVNIKALFTWLSIGAKFANPGASSQVPGRGRSSRRVTAVRALSVAADVASEGDHVAEVMPGLVVE